MQRAAQRHLPAHAAVGHPVAQGFRFANHQARQALVGFPSRYLTQVFPEFVFAVRAGDVICRPSVHIADVAGVAAVAAAKIFDRAYENQHPRAGAPRADCGAQSGVPPPRQRERRRDASNPPLSEQNTFGPVESEQLTHEQRSADDGAGVDKRIEPSRSDPARRGTRK